MEVAAQQLTQGGIPTHLQEENPCSARSRPARAPSQSSSAARPASAARPSGSSPPVAAEAHDVLGLLAQLPDAQRQVITLAFYGQLTHTEIAEHLHLPAGTVKGRMRLGLQRLRDDIDRVAS